MFENTTSSHTSSSENESGENIRYKEDDINNVLISLTNALTAMSKQQEQFQETMIQRQEDFYKNVNIQSVEDFANIQSPYDADQTNSLIEQFNKASQEEQSQQKTSLFLRK